MLNIGKKKKNIKYILNELDKTYKYIANFIEKGFFDIQNKMFIIHNNIMKQLKEKLGENIINKDKMDVIFKLLYPMLILFNINNVSIDIIHAFIKLNCLSWIIDNYNKDEIKMIIKTFLNDESFENHPYCKEWIEILNVFKNNKIKEQLFNSLIFNTFSQYYKSNLSSSFMEFEEYMRIRRDDLYFDHYIIFMYYSLNKSILSSETDIINIELAIKCKNFAILLNDIFSFEKEIKSDRKEKYVFNMFIIKNLTKTEDFHIFLKSNLECLNECIQFYFKIENNDVEIINKILCTILLSNTMLYYKTTERYIKIDIKKCQDILKYAN